ncbi:DUF1449 family protein, partial [Candidatus Pacearchaeota archaeon]|nr:DUF1449 family protein [Candidatus Pacearchaeota archaeon]
MGPMNLLQWYNIIFIGPAGLALLYLTISIATGIDGADSEFDGDADGHIGGHDEFDDHFDGHGGDAHDHGDHGDHASEVDDSDHHVSVGSDVLGILNLRNRCPKTFGFSVLFLTWGICGFFINTIIANWWGVFFIPAVLANVVLSLFVAVMSVRMIAPRIAAMIP